jgi:hypothetical protein
MYVTISQEISRQHRGEIMHVVKLAPGGNGPPEPRRKVPPGTGPELGARAVRGAP